MQLAAYHNNPELKQAVLAEMAEHRIADRLVQNYGYWKDGKGCAVGCLIKSGNHMDYEPRFGIPVMLARLEDRIFEGLPVEEARQWPERFLGAIPTGADLSRVGWQFLHWLLSEHITLKDHTDAAIQHHIDEARRVMAQAADVIAPLSKGERPDKAKARQLAEDARSVRRAAAYAAAAAAAAAAAYAADAAAYAADAAAYAAAAAAYAADAAAYAAAAADAAADAAAAWRKARAGSYLAMAEKLIELLAAASA